MRALHFFRWGIIIIITIDIFLWLYDPLINKKVIDTFHTSFHHQVKGEFTLTDHNGQERNSNEFRGKYVLIYFGYTLCNNNCNVILKNISHALNNIEINIEKIVPIFITIDPGRDTVATLNSYARNLHSTFILLTGTHEQITAVLNNFRVYKFKIKSPEAISNSLLEHSNLIYLLDCDGRLLKSFDHDTSSEVLEDEINGLLKRF